MAYVKPLNQDVLVVSEDREWQGCAVLCWREPSLDRVRGTTIHKAYALTVTPRAIPYRQLSHYTKIFKD